MSKDYLKIGQAAYRVEANWNAIADFCRRRNLSSLSQLDVLVNIAVDDILTLMHCCIKEGERLECRPFELTEEDLGAEVNTYLMGEFVKLYASQSRVEAAEERVKKKWLTR